ncbi:uncharacterized protein LAESUDRAFT_757742 [Laetiporus sulphureus 93-53]|uniref:DUF6534 domain-containing protein n=1 Tax=Laetiporus sulphureus 93-53 TaxID=1314785 RepID=A0A165F6Z8_9APHY|nr:uncharacterized protein LAESUDRAFT_757742 [Laetiporus sulphureus 93-53]KZT08508.1 hypothetical protein LAESUDRAFT_757742 [Laetiporus sulphureus 93-53]
MVQVTPSNARTSLGSLVIGGLAATALSGVVMMQTILYARIFEKDATILKTIVATIFALDIFHTCLVWAAMWQYFVSSFGDANITDHVFWTAGLTIAMTAITTFVVHMFFSYRLLRLSRGNYFITVPMVLVAFGRLVSAVATSAEMIRARSYYEFYAHYRWLFTLGLVLSTAADITITSGLCIFLRINRHGGSGRLDHILNSVTLYTVENGMITCVATVLSLIFWLVKPHALIYLGLHFAISKLYANSFLASMNARKLLRTQNATSSEEEGHRLPVIFAHHISHDRRDSADEVDLTGTKLQINVDKTVDYVTDDPIPSPPRHHSGGSKIVAE